MVILSSCSKEDDLLTPVPTPNTTQNTNINTDTSTVTNTQIYDSEYDVTHYSYSLLVDRKNLWWTGCPPSINDTTITYESNNGDAYFTDNGTGVLTIPSYIRDFEEYAYVDTHVEGHLFPNSISTISIENNKVCLGLYYNTTATTGYPSRRVEFTSTLTILQNTGSTLILESNTAPEGRGFIKNIKIELQKK
tara:strand:- start:60 stop:635 length:576 start_codon:yes stop_codon:yes gene_type:complete